MDKGTLIDVVAMIDARVASLNKYIEKYNEDTAHAQVFELQRLSKHLQVAIDADIASMESNTGE
jgi:hypothetical protein